MSSGTGSGPLLEVRDLRTGFHTAHGTAWAVDGVDLTLHGGRTLGIVGESGSGKTMLGRSILRLMPRTNVETAGSIVFSGRDLTGLTEPELRHVRGADIAMVFQDPMTSLNPVVKISRQITESLRFHDGPRGRDAKQRALELLRSVHIPDPGRRLKEYPHQLSGGMRQRVSIAVALACNPQLLIADEPTTALDVTVQAQILDLLAEQQRVRNMAMILITHDLGVVARRTDRIAVMYAGQIVEIAPTLALFTRMRMPYTEALMSSIPKLDDGSHTRLRAIPGSPPNLIERRPGCRFVSRCRYAQARCHQEVPPLVEDDPGHFYRCWFPLPVEPSSAHAAVDRAGGADAGSGSEDSPTPVDHGRAEIAS